MDCFYVLLILGLFLFRISYSAVLDVYISKEIKDFENCPSSVKGPTVNITHTEDYNSITACWRFLITAYPPCAGSSCKLMAARNEKNRPDDWWKGTGGNMHHYSLYQPISGMSVNGRHAGWLGYQFNETGKGSWKQVTWWSLSYNNILKINEWQSVCTSYSKANNRKQLFHNGVKYLDRVVKEDPDNIFISKDFFSNLYITESFRGSFSDLQVYSNPMEEKDLLEWTTCKNTKPGDVFQWDIKRLNLTSQHKTVISSFGTVDSKAFCPEKGSSNKEIHLFGDKRFDPMSNVEANIVCKRLNGKIKLIPSTKEGISQLKDYLGSFAKKSNETAVQRGWLGGVSKLVVESGVSHPYPDEGIYNVVDRETGESLINAENKKYIETETQSYQILEEICMNIRYYPPPKDKLTFGWTKCNRKFIGRVMCEFNSTPEIKVKGLCKQSPIDKDFLLIDPKPGEGKNIGVTEPLKSIKT